MPYCPQWTSTACPVYTSLVFIRQVPKLVKGGIRLFVNMIEAD